jgi:hypothetical protein
LGNKPDYRDLRGIRHKWTDLAQIKAGEPLGKLPNIRQPLDRLFLRFTKSETA